MDEYAFGSVRSQREAIDRMPSGVDFVAVLRRLGLWTSQLHRQVCDRPPFPSSLAELSDDEVSDLSAYWTAELGRTVELVGLIKSQMVQMRVRGSRVRATVRSRLRTAHTEQAAAGEGRPKELSATALNQLADDDPDMLTHLEQAGYLEMLLAQADAVREATASYVATVSREITLRGDHMRSRLR